jgi:hypothetical protein
MQKVILDLLPGGVAPIVYASQYDDGRSIRFMLTEGGPDNQYILNSNEVITCNLTKPDGTETVINVTNPGGGEHYVDLVNGADDYDQAGAYLGEIVLTRNTKVIGSANFVLKVEEDAYGGQITTASATGNPCTFTTDLADALVSLTAEIVAGGGNGSPDNPIPINGYTEANITRCGVNLFDKTNIADGYIDDSNGQVSGGAYYKHTDYIPVVGGQKIYIMTEQTAAKWGAWYDENKNYISGITNYSQTEATAPNNACFIRLTCKTEDTGNLDTFGVNYPSTPTYTPYNGQTFTVAFGQTVYGGVYDKSGRLTITWAGVDMGSLTWQVIEYQGISYKVSNSIASTVKAPTASSETANIKCSIFKNVSRDELDNYNYVICIDPNKNIDIIDNDYSTAADFTTAMNGIILAYELATPIVIDVTSISVFAENGVNNIVSDCLGDVSVTYIKKV